MINVDFIHNTSNDTLPLYYDNETSPNNDSLMFTYDLYQAIRQRLDGPSQSTLADIPDGHFFSLILLVVISSIGGFLVNLIRLPPLLGMMVAGIILRNVPGNLLDPISPAWSSTLRNIALVIILLRGGLSLDAKKLWSLKFVLPLLAILPCVFEGALDSIIAIFLLQMPWQWGLATGYLLSAISPAVVVPTILTLKEKVVGVNEGITTLIVAAANIDVVIAISLFSIFLGLIFSEGSIVLDIFRAPIEISVGLIYGVITGLILWIIPTVYHSEASKHRNRFFLLFGFGLFSLFGGRRVVIGGSSLAGAGALGTLVVSFTAVQKWNSEDKKVITRVFYLVWQFAQPVLFGLVGAALDISSIDGSLFGMALVVIICGLVLRVIVAVVVVTGNKFTIKEKIFIGLSWLPKATVQAALGSVPLDLAIIANNDSFKALGQTVI
jgi:NhaP-type Na+/H+ or K+/H+ antiporter